MGVIIRRYDNNNNNTTVYAELLIIEICVGAIMVKDTTIKKRLLI
jgi:hypothetical protein